MKDQSWLRDALRAATTNQPQGTARATGALHRARQRKRQRVTAASCATVAAVFAAAALTSGGSGSTGLQPVTPPTSTAATPEPTTTYSPSPEPTASADPTSTGAPRPASPPPPSPSATQRVVIRYPATPPGPLDVYFMVDSTVTMRHHDNAVRSAIAGIVGELDWRDALFGYATFNDWTVPPSSEPIYRRYSRIMVDPPMPRFTYDGGGDPAEAHTLGLDAAIGVAHAPYTEPGQDAGFRPDARKVIVLITDGAMKQGSGYPAKAEVAQRLRERGVSVVALSITSFGEDVARGDLVEMAEATGGVAAKSADCDGDGQVDIRRGDAIVCVFDSENPGRYAGFADLIRALA